jgi:TIR domain
MVKLLVFGPVLVAATSLWILRFRHHGQAAPEQSSAAEPPAPGSPARVPNRRTRLSHVALSRIAGEHAPPTQDADVIVFAPASGPPREEVLVQVFVNTPDQAEAALGQARRTDSGGAVLAMRPLEIPLRVGDQIKLTLESDAEVPADSVQHGSWNGRWVCFYFMLKLPDVAAEKVVLSRLRVFVNGTPAGLVLFKIKAMPGAPDLLPSLVPQESRAWKKFFISYASEDRVEVLKAVQVMNALKVDYFQDLLTLSPGDRWEPRLFAEIENCDVFLLFWSRHARQSEWVIREAEHALICSRAASGRPAEIVPVLLEGPPPPLPPDSLRDIHFNDPIRYVIFAAETTGLAQQPPTLVPQGPERLEISIGSFTRGLEIGTIIEPQSLGSVAAIFDPAPIAEAIAGPAGSNGLGLRNLSSITWQAKLPNGTTIDVAPGHAVRLGPGLVIKFGNMETEGVVRSTNGRGG